MNQAVQNTNVPGKEPGWMKRPAFDREEWIHQKNADRQKAFELIDEATELAAADTDRLKTYLDVQSRFPRYSVGNALLVSVQKPDATRILDFKGWRDIGVHIKRGENAIILMEPGKSYTREDGSTGVYYNTKRVFDITQTTSYMLRDRSADRDPGTLIRELDSLAPCEVRTDGEGRLPEGMCAYYDPEEGVLYAAQDLTGPGCFRGTARELAHAHLHLDSEDYSREACEFSAECVAYMLCRRCGVDTAGFVFDEPPQEYQIMELRDIRSRFGLMRRISNIIVADMDRLNAMQQESAVRDEAR